MTYHYGISATQRNLMIFKCLEFHIYIYIYNYLIVNKLHNFLIFLGISDDGAAVRRASVSSCVPGIQGFKDLRFKDLRFKDSISFTV